MKKNMLTLAIVAVMLIGCTSAQVTKNPSTGQNQTNYVVDPKLTSTLGTIGAINAASAPVNPFSGLVEIGLGATALIAAWFAKRKNDQAAASALLTKTLVQAVDGLDQQPVKDAIQAHAVRVGVEGQLNQVVKAVGSGLL